MDPANSRRDIEIVVRPISTISGKVLNEETGEGVSKGTVIAEMRFDAEPFRRSSPLSEAGEYTIEGLLPGSYRVEAVPQGYVFAFYLGGDANGSLTIRSGDEIVGIDVTVSRGLAISGTAVGLGGTAMEGASVFAGPAQGSGYRPFPPRLSWSEPEQRDRTLPDRGVVRE